SRRPEQGRAMYQVGFGTGDITPEPGMNIPGGFLKNIGKGVRDHRLLAVACVVSDGAKTVALVGVDALFVTGEMVQNARRMLWKDTRIPGDNILVGANHTHSGGPVVAVFDYGDDPKYIEMATKGIVAAVKQAYGSLHGSEIGCASGSVEGIAFN